MTLSSFPELQKLPRRQKFQLADELWQSGVSDAMPVTTAQKKLLDERWAAYQAGTAKRISISELKRRLGKKMRRQSVESLDFVEEDVRSAMNFYASWRSDGASYFEKQFFETLSWMDGFFRGRR